MDKQRWMDRWKNKCVLWLSCVRSTDDIFVFQNVTTHQIINILKSVSVLLLEILQMSWFCLIVACWQSGCFIPVLFSNISSQICITILIIISENEDHGWVEVTETGVREGILKTKAAPIQAQVRISEAQEEKSDEP